MIARRAESVAAAREAATAARHLGTLAMLDNTLEALSAFRRAAELDPPDVWTWIQISRLEVQRSDLGAAGIAARRAREAAHEAQDEGGIAAADDALGNVLVQRGNLTDALAAYRASRAIAERLAAADPANIVWQRDLFVSYYKLGKVKEGQGDLFAAHEWYAKAEPIIRRLVGIDPTNATWRQDLAWLEDRLRATAAATS